MITRDKPPKPAKTAAAAVRYLFAHALESVCTPYNSHVLGPGVADAAQRITSHHTSLRGQCESGRPNDRTSSVCVRLPCYRALVGPDSRQPTSVQSVRKKNRTFQRTPFTAANRHIISGYVVARFALPGTVLCDIED